MNPFGQYLRMSREARSKTDKAFSLRQVAQKAGLEPAYLSKIERGIFPPPSEAAIVKLAQILAEDPDVLLALAGKMSKELQQIIIQRPKLFADLLRQLKDAPEHAILRVAREVKDGKW